MRFTACIAHQDDETVWTSNAVASLIGQRPIMDGQHVEVLRAWLDGDRIMVEVETP